MSVEIHGRHLLIDGTPRFLQAGDIQYYRLARGDWEDRLDKLAAAGLNTVAAYVPWYFHEPAEGQFDFTGETLPERDLVGFIELVHARGLFLFPRPGPFVNSDLRNGGHPEWLFERYPEIQSHRADGTLSYWEGNGALVPSQLQPKYLEMVDRWFRHVVPVLARYTHDRGGPVILSQPDNEMNAVFTYGIHGSLYDTYVVGDETREGRWHRWLRDRYATLDVVSSRYGLKARSWPEIRPPREKGSGAGDARRALDWVRFKQSFIFDYATWLMERMRSLGLDDVPQSLNEPINGLWPWSPGAHAAAIAHFNAKDQRQVFTTSHCYMYAGEQDFLGAPAAISHAQMVKSSGAEGPAMVVETSSGWFDIASPTIGERAPYNLDILMRLHLGCGLDGYNYWPFAGGRNSPDAQGRTGRWYDWAVPVRTDGSLHSTFAKAQAHAELVSGWEQEILATEQVCDVTLGLFDDLPLLARYTEDRLDLPTGGGRVVPAPGLCEDVFLNTAETLTLLTNANIAARYTILDWPHLEPGPALGPLMVPCPGVLPAAGIEFIRRHLELGGRAMLFPALPTLTTDLEPTDRLAELVQAELAAVVPIRGAGPGDWLYKTVSGRNVEDAAVARAICTYEPKPGATLDVLATFESRPCAFRQRALAGELIVCGIMPRYITEDSLALWQELLATLGVERNAYADGGRYLVLHRADATRADGPSLLVVVNARGDEAPAEVRVRTGAGWVQFPKLGNFELMPKEARSLWVNVPAGAARIVYCTSELAPVDKDRRSFRVRGAVGTDGEIALDRQVSVRYDGQALPLVERDGSWLARYAHGRTRGLLTLGLD